MAKQRNYSRLARVACDAALSGKHPPALTAYYAKLALWADKKARAQVGMES